MRPVTYASGANTYVQLQEGYARPSVTTQIQVLGVVITAFIPEPTDPE